MGRSGGWCVWVRGSSSVLITDFIIIIVDQARTGGRYSHLDATCSLSVCIYICIYVYESMHYQFSWAVPHDSTRAHPSTALRMGECMLHCIELLAMTRDSALSLRGR